jgi:hypothetical protein
MANFRALVAGQRPSITRTAHALFVGLAALGASGCDEVVTGSGHVIEEERLVSGFDGVRLDAEGDILLAQGATEGLVIEAEDNLVAELVTEVVAGQLVIRTRPDIELEPTRPIVYRVTIADIHSLAIDGSGSVFAHELATDELELAIDGSGDIRLEALRANRIQTSIDGSGDIALSGVVDAELVEIDGSGNYDALELQARSGHAGIDGSGDVRMYVTDELSVAIDGSGDVLVKGEARVSSQVSGSGTVRRVPEAQ